MKSNLFNFKKSNILHLIKEQFVLSDNMADRQEIAQSIENASILKGSNLWILVLAILVCSIGLNVNSTAVIIGAMLISPLMGPINAIGFGVAILDFPLIRSSLKTLLFSVFASLMTSAIYFWLTPLGQAQSEILARTSPSLWDVLIALSGGIAGMIGSTRKIGNNVAPGVAIATALMPPLCTAGYGLATLQWHFLFGAFYLFIINSVFIALGSLFITKLLHFRRKTYVNAKYAKRVSYAIITVAFLTITPSAYLAFHLVQQSILQSNVQKFINQEIQSEESPVFSSRIVGNGNKKTLEIVVIGKEISFEKIEAWKKSMFHFGLEKMELKISQPSVMAYGDTVLTLRTDLLKELNKTNEEKQNEKDKTIETLTEELQKVEQKDLETRKIFSELTALIPAMEDCALAITTPESKDGVINDKKILLAYVKTKGAKPLNSPEQTKIRDWLKTRTNTAEVQVVFNHVK